MSKISFTLVRRGFHCTNFHETRDYGAEFLCSDAPKRDKKWGNCGYKLVYPYSTMQSTASTARVETKLTFPLAALRGDLLFRILLNSDQKFGNYRLIHQGRRWKGAMFRRSGQQSQKFGKVGNKVYTSIEQRNMIF